jgi:hypothetical protein
LLLFLDELLADESVTSHLLFFFVFSAESDLLDLDGMDSSLAPVTTAVSASSSESLEDSYILRLSEHGKERKEK